ncbi:MAG: PIG-L family deacetylase [Mycobacteriales bacterium]
MATVIALHAHPDDEVLLTGGTLATLAAAGHRVQVVFATDGGAGLAAETERGLGRTRATEARAASAALGLRCPLWLGYADSGEDAVRPENAFADADPDEAATRLAEILAGQRADMLLTYDANGGYGHPDHRQAHLVGMAAARRAGTPRVLQATVDRTLLRRATNVLRLVPGLPDAFTARRLTEGFTAREGITHRLDVSRQCGAKRRALAAHVSQSGGGGELRTLALLLRLPTPLFTRALRHEWFREEALLGTTASRPRADLGLPEPRSGPAPPAR